jgi:hypothetical protein
LIDGRFRRGEQDVLACRASLDHDVSKLDEIGVAPPSPV